MLPDSVTTVRNKEYSEKYWQDHKTLIDKAKKTGLGAELTTLKSAWDGAKDVIKKMDVKMIGKLRNEAEIKQAKADAENTLTDAHVVKLLHALDTASKKADAASKMKLSSAATKTAKNIATGLAGIKHDLENATFTDFDDKLTQLEQAYKAQRQDFSRAAKALMEYLKVIEAKPVLDSISGTKCSGPFRDFQNKVGNLPEFASVYDDSFDGLFVERLPKNITNEQVKQYCLKLVNDSRAYIKKVLVTAKAKGY